MRVTFTHKWRREDQECYVQQGPCCADCLDMGMPAGATCAHITFNSEYFDSNWKGFKLLLFGMVTPTGQENPPGSLFGVLDAEGNIVESTQLWRMLAAYQDSNIYAERVWDPEKGKFSEGVENLEYATSKGEYERMWMALRMLRHMSPVGRPLQSGYFNSPGELGDAVVQAIAGFMKQGRKYGQNEVATFLDISPRTLGDSIRRQKLSWRNLKRAGEEEFRRQQNPSEIP